MLVLTQHNLCTIWQKTALPVEKIAQINKGQIASKSLSSTAGKTKPELTLEAMLSMDDSELEDNWSKIKKLMG